MTPLNRKIYFDRIPEQGKFGVIRKYDIHTGIDLYCRPGDSVYAIEDGVVVNVCDFTGINAGSPWWNDTQAVLIKGKSGVLLYGEVFTDLVVGEKVEEGDVIAFVKTVLKNDKGLPMTMLHMELYEHDYTGNGEWWKHGETKPEKLLNIEEFLIKVDYDNDWYARAKDKYTVEEIADGIVGGGQYYLTSQEEYDTRLALLEHWKENRKKL